MHALIGRTRRHPVFDQRQPPKRLSVRRARHPGKPHRPVPASDQIRSGKMPPASTPTTWLPARACITPALFGSNGFCILPAAPIGTFPA